MHFTPYIYVRSIPDYLPELTVILIFNIFFNFITNLAPESAT